MAQQYRPLYKLDSGGMAEVYVAEAITLAGYKKKVAIKRILPGLLKEERFVRMFLDEARLSLHLSHANVVSVSDIGKTDNTYFIVMEFIEGTTLKSLLEYHAKQGRTMPVHLCIWIINEVLKGLHYAHTLPDPDSGELLGIVHRDISPPNILISWNGEVKLTDFGLAKATTQLESTDPGIVKGKFAYLSPEGARGETVDCRSDIFAVGILLWEMLTSQRLFLGESDWKTIERIRSAEVPSIRSINPEVPEVLEAIVQKALSLRPEDRFASAADFADELIGVLFSQQMRVSARDLIGLVASMRNGDQVPEFNRPTPSQSITTPPPGETDSSPHLILDLLNEELNNFESIDDEEPNLSAEEKRQNLIDNMLDSLQVSDDLIDASQPLDASPEFQRSQKFPAIPEAAPNLEQGTLNEQAGDHTPTSHPHATPAQAQVQQGLGNSNLPPIRTPNPHSEQTGSGRAILWGLLSILIFGGSVAAYLLGAFGT